MSRRLADLFARWSPARSERETLAFVQKRLALYGKMMFLSFVPLLGYINLMYAIYPVTRPANAGMINTMAAVGLVVLGVVWAIAARDRVYSSRTLFGVDTAAVVIIGAVFAASATLSSDKTANVYSSFIWGSFAVFGRVLVVPSSGRRTLVMSALGMAPLAVVSLFLTTETPRLAQFAGAVIFCLVIVALSTTGSHVIYGLRAQVKEAMQLGQYTIGDKIGEGGMGSVYRARHAMLRRPTAIKLLRPERTGSESLRRFEREVQLTSELTHPNTVAVYDYGRSPDGIFYYAMEYLEGIELEALVHRYGAQPPGRVIHILRQVCGALAEAHERGLIHRDVKPGNIMLCERGGAFDVAKVLDFGLVLDRAVPGADAADDADGEVSGTPAYLAPEAINAPETVTFASDLYALGAVGYFLLTGCQVFEARSVVQVLMHHTETAPTPPSRRTDRRVPADLEALILQCLEKSPGRRPASAAALRDALAGLTDAAAWTEIDARAWWGARRTALASQLAAR